MINTQIIMFIFRQIPLCLSITPSLFHPGLKTYPFHKSYPRSFTSSSRTASTDFCPRRFFWAARFLTLVFPYFLADELSGPLVYVNKQLVETSGRQTAKYDTIAMIDWNISSGQLLAVTNATAMWRHRQLCRWLANYRTEIIRQT